MKTIKLKNKKGFTLIEMLIAVFIFTVSLTSLMAISGKALSTAKEANRQVVADYLAVEALESVRHIRDSAFLAGTSSDWNLVFGGHDVFPGCDTDGAYCDFYYEDYPILQGCGSCMVWKTGDEKYLHLKSGTPSTGLSDSGYTRRISFDQLSSQEVLVTVEVAWSTGLVTAHEGLFLWF